MSPQYQAIKDCGFCLVSRVWVLMTWHPYDGISPKWSPLPVVPTVYMEAPCRLCFFLQVASFLSPLKGQGNKEERPLVVFHGSNHSTKGTAGLLFSSDNTETCL